MVTEPHLHTRKHDPTLAREILVTIKQLANFSRVQSLYPQQTSKLLQNLKLLDASPKANNIPAILQLLRECRADCDNFTGLSKEQAEITTLINDCESNLQEIAGNIKELEDALKTKINITCALDGYTLNRTTSLLASLEEFIHEQDVRTNFLAQDYSDKTIAKNIYAFPGSRKRMHQLKEIVIAKELKEIVTMIRSQIGSDETMPRGLLINFVMHLSNAFCHCDQVNPKLLACIQKEIQEIKQAYPDLAQAGQELQEAVANYQLQKP